MKPLDAILDGPEFARLCADIPAPIRPDEPAERERVEADKDTKRRLRDATPTPWAHSHEGSEL